MNKLEVFEFEGNKVRTQIDQDGNVWFRVKDVCEVLGVKNYRDVVSKLEKDDVDLIDTIDSLGRTQSVRYTNESGLYDIVLQSRKPEARKFRRWVTSEVLPSIRKTGSYNLSSQTPALPTNFKEALLMLVAAEEEKEALNKELVQLQPKGEFYDSVMSSEKCIDMKAVAKVLNCGMGRNKLFELLRNKNILDGGNEPYQRFVDQGLFEVDLISIVINGAEDIKTKTVVTPKGVEYISKLVKSSTTKLLK